MSDSTAVAVIPYQQLEKMAVTVAKSGLFGVKNPDSAMALMMLAQAEGIHPMTAVRDYHIMDVKGRIVVTMKADAMLARFQEVGGRIEWLCNSDVKAEAKFTHPSGGELIMEWTIERARKANLTGKDVWQAYPRAMLKARVISEGIRTILPGVIAGKYNPEEAQHIETVEAISVEQAVQSFDQPGLAGALVTEWLEVISVSPDMPALKAAYQSAFNIAKEARDEKRMGSFTLAYEARKSELQQQQPPPATDKPEPIEGEVI